MELSVYELAFVTAAGTVDHDTVTGALILYPCAGIVGTVCPTVSTLTVAFSIHKGAFINIAAGGGHFTIAVTLTVTPVALVYRAIIPSKCALSMAHTIDQIAGVAAVVGTAVLHIAGIAVDGFLLTQILHRQIGGGLQEAQRFGRQGIRPADEVRCQTVHRSSAGIDHNALG